MENKNNNEFIIINNVIYNYKDIITTQKKNNLNMLDFLTNLGIIIPRFCYHPKLSIAGNCRMCLIEVSDSVKPVVSCAMGLRPNIKIYTESNLIKKARQNILEFMLVNHPLDCPICDQGGECDLQDQTILYGNDRGRFYENKKVTLDKNCSPFIKTIMTRCIHCTRCIRFLNDLASSYDLGMLGRGSKMEIGTYLNNKLIHSELSGNIIDLCPVGALTSKSYSFKARPWELRKHNSFDIFDTFGSSINVFTKNSYKIYRVLPANNEMLNEQWISDRTRFFYDAIYNQRLSFPYKYSNILKKYVITTWSDFNLFLKVVTKIKNKKKLNILISHYFVDNFEIINLKKLKNINIYNYDFNLNKIDNDFRFNYTNIFNQKYNFEDKFQNNIFILLGINNLRYENPLFNLQFLKNSKNIKKSDIFLSIGPSFHSNFPINFISNNSNYFIKFLKGKTHLNILVKKYIDNKYTLNLIIGPSYINLLNNNNNLDFLYLKNYFFKMYKNPINICILFNNLYYLNSFEFNLRIKNLRNYHIDDNIYDNFGLVLENNVKHLINIPLLNKFLKKNIVNLFFNSHGHEFINENPDLIFDYLLPNTTFNEKTIYSYNLYGFLLKSEKFCKKFKKSKNFLFLINFLSKKLKIEKNQTYLSKLVINNIYLNTDFIYDIENVTQLTNLNKFVVEHGPMYTSYDNPYIIDNITSWSNNLQEAYSIYEQEFSKNFKNLVLY